MNNLFIDATSSQILVDKNELITNVFIIPINDFPVNILFIYSFSFLILFVQLFYLFIF